MRLQTPLLTRGRGPHDGDLFHHIIEALCNEGYVILADVFDIRQLQGLFIDIKATDSQHFHTAGIGREQDYQLNSFVRRDRIRWLDRDHLPVRFYLDWIEQLRLRLNRELFLGLFDFECHYAHYPKGAFYKKHLDAFRGTSIRRLTTILYLNPGWQPADGGELIVYGEDSQTMIETVLPMMGTLVLFLSEQFPHEVLPAKRSRYSLTGWYRVNNTDSANLDPAR